MVSLMTGISRKWREICFQRRAGVCRVEPGFDAAMCRWGWAPLLSLCLSFTHVSLLDYRLEYQGRIDWRRRKIMGLMCGCWSPVTAPVGHMVLPEVVLKRSRHAIHRGVRETCGLRRHTRLPSTKPLLYGGRPVLNFAQQPSSVVGDVVLWHSTTVWRNSYLFQSEITLFLDYSKYSEKI